MGSLTDLPYLTGDLGGILRRIGAQAAGEGVIGLQCQNIGAAHLGLPHTGDNMVVLICDADNEAVGNGKYLAGQSIGAHKAAHGVLYAVDLTAAAQQAITHFTHAVQQSFVVHKIPP